MTSPVDDAEHRPRDIFHNDDGSLDRSTLGILALCFVALVGFFVWRNIADMAESARDNAEAAHVCEGLLDAARSGRLTAADLAAGGCRQEARTFVIERAAVPSLAPSKL